MLDRVPDEWDTKRLTVRAVREADIDTLLALFNANAAVAAWDPTFAPIERDELARLVHKSLTWADTEERPFQLQCFVERRTGALLGYYHCTYGAPHADTLWLSMFVMGPCAQRGGYGREVVEGLGSFWPMLRDIRRAWAEVWLKNWPALRFWINAGFNSIVEWRGDKQPAEGAFASLILEKRWRGSPEGPKRLL